MNSEDKRPQGWTPEQRLEALLATHGLAEQTLGAWCRARGIHTHHLVQWRRELIEGSPEKSAGSGGARALRQENRARKAFVKDILGTRPGFNGENDTFDVEVTNVLLRGTLQDGVAEKNIGEVVQGLSWKGKKSVTKIGEIMTADYESQGFTVAKVIRMTSYFRADLAERIERGRGRELPGFMSFDVFSALIAEYMQLWEEPTAAFQTTVADALKNAAVSTVLKHTSQLPELTDALTRLVKAEVSTMATEATGQLGKLLLPEMTMPSTENHYLFDTLNKIRNDRVAKKIKELADDR